MYVRTAFTSAFGAEIPLTGYEFKSKNSRSWWWAKKNDKPVSNDGNFMQAASYDILVENLAKRGELPDERLLDIKRWVVVNVSKDDNLIAEEGPNLGHRNAVLERLRILNEAYETRTLPPCSCIESGWEWAYCSHYAGTEENRRKRADGKRVDPDGPCCVVAA